MNPNTMTIDDIRDELARKEGWTIYTDGLPLPHYLAPGKHPDADCQLNHPIPATLDEAAKLPEGWVWSQISRDALGNWVAIAQHNETEAQVFGESDANDGGTELLARFRLRLACTLADEGSKT